MLGEVGALDRPVGNAGEDAIGPGIAIGKDNHRQVKLRVQPLYHPPGGPGRLAFDVNQNGIVLLIKAVLDQPGIHPAGLNGHDHPGIMADELDVVHVEGYLIACLAHILLAVHLLLSPAGLLFQAQRPEDCCSVLLWPDVKVLPVQIGYDLQVLYQPVALRLLMKLGYIPVLGDVIDLS